MHVSPLTSSERFMHGFWGLRQAVMCRINPKIKAGHGLEIIDLMLLHHIARTEMSPSEIAESMQIHAPTLSRRLEALERNALIARDLDRQDARRRVLSLTLAGQKILGEAGDLLQRELGAMLEGLNERDLERFLGHLEALARPLQEQP